MEKKKFDEKLLLRGFMLKQKDIITSRQNPTVKRVCALAEKRERRAEGLFRFDGSKLFCEAVQRGLDIKYAVIRENVSEDIIGKVESAVAGGRLAEGAVLRVSESVFEKISEERAPEGIVTVAAFMPNKHRVLSAEDAANYCARKEEKLLIAESLRDPGNLGTVIRSCAALGIDRLLISDDCADIYSPKVLRAAMGGLFAMDIDTVPLSSLPDAILSLRRQGRRVYATALHEKARRIGSFTLECGDCFLIGNEGHGLSRNVIDACDACALIPMTEGSESLNAAAAAAICIWETVRS